jgi:hypothetical protein
MKANSVAQNSPFVKTEGVDRALFDAEVDADAAAPHKTGKNETNEGDKKKVIMAEHP